MAFNFRVEGLRGDEGSGVHIRQIVKPSLILMVFYTYNPKTGSSSPLRWLGLGYKYRLVAIFVPLR